MVFVKVLSPFTEFVEGTGMIVGNAGAMIDLPIRFARQRRARGYVDFDDADAEEAAVADAARPRTQKERRLLARSARRAAETGNPGPASRTPAPKAQAKPKRAARHRSAAKRRSTAKRKGGAKTSSAAVGTRASTAGLKVAAPTASPSPVSSDAPVE